MFGNRQGPQAAPGHDGVRTLVTTGPASGPWSRRGPQAAPWFPSSLARGGPYRRMAELGGRPADCVRKGGGSGEIVGFEGVDRTVVAVELDRPRLGAPHCGDVLQLAERNRGAEPALRAPVDSAGAARPRRDDELPAPER